MVYYTKAEWDAMSDQEKRDLSTEYGHHDRIIVNSKFEERNKNMIKPGYGKDGSGT